MPIVLYLAVFNRRDTSEEEIAGMVDVYEVDQALYDKIRIARITLDLNEEYASSAMVEDMMVPLPKHANEAQVITSLILHGWGVFTNDYLSYFRYSRDIVWEQVENWIEAIRNEKWE